MTQTSTAAKRYLRNYRGQSVIERGDGEWAGLEIKLGSETGVTEGIDALHLFRSRIDTKRMGEPRKLAVITAGGLSFELPDGIAVIPITALGP